MLNKIKTIVGLTLYQFGVIPVLNSKILLITLILRIVLNVLMVLVEFKIIYTRYSIRMIIVKIATFMSDLITLAGIKCEKEKLFW